MRTLQHVVEIDAPPAVVWRVLTTRDLVREWAAAFLEDIDIRCAWRESGPVEWKAPGGAILQRGVVGALEPERLLRFDYPAHPESRAHVRALSDVWSLAADGRCTRLTFATGPLTPQRCTELEPAHRSATETIKSLAEEAAVIGRRRPSSPSREA